MKTLPLPLNRMVTEPHSVSWATAISSTSVANACCNDGDMVDTSKANLATRGEVAEPVGCLLFKDLSLTRLLLSSSFILCTLLGFVKSIPLLVVCFVDTS